MDEGAAEWAPEGYLQGLPSWKTSAAQGRQAPACGRGDPVASFRPDALTPPPLQRDLDFTVDLDFKGQLCETSVSNYYKMR